MYDLTKQLDLIQELLPEATRCGIFLDDDDHTTAAMVNMVQQQVEIRLIQAPVHSMRETTNAMRQLNNQFDVDFFIILSERKITSKNAIKYITKHANKYKRPKPVFTTSENGLEGEALGQLVQRDGAWSMLVNGDVLADFEITVPSDNPRYAVQRQ